MNRVKPGTIYVGPCVDDGNGIIRAPDGEPTYWVCYESGTVGALSFNDWWAALRWSWAVRWLRPLVKPFAELAFSAGQRSARGYETPKAPKPEPPSEL